MSPAYEALHSSAAWIDLSDRGKIRVTGEDRARLIHAMSTNDVEHLSPGSGVYAFFLTAVGRILADAYIYNLGESLFLDTEPETAAKLAEHLDKYIIADDATLENEMDRWACIGIEGPQWPTAAAQIGLPAVANFYAVVSTDDGFVAQVASTGRQGIRIWVPPALKEVLIDRLKAACIPQATPAEVRVVRIENGIPRYGEDISERYLVQETQQTHAVHPNKGCYLGQEIVERVRSRGQVHRVLTPLRIHTTVLPSPGTKLAADADLAAEITSAAFSPALGEVVALGYVRTEPAHTKRLLTIVGSDPPVTAHIV
jgi:folate-binding protein YgfZ